MFAGVFASWTHIFMMYLFDCKFNIRTYDVSVTNYTFAGVAVVLMNVTHSNQLSV